MNEAQETELVEQATLKTNEQALKDNGWTIEEHVRTHDGGLTSIALIATKPGLHPMGMAYPVDEADPQKTEALREECFEKMCATPDWPIIGEAERIAGYVLRLSEADRAELFNRLRAQGPIIVDEKRPSPEDAVRILNEALEAEPDAVQAIFEKYQINATTLAMHRTIQVGGMPDRPTLSALGLINGIFGVDERGWGPIAAAYDVSTGRILRFGLTSEVAQDQRPDRAG